MVIKSFQLALTHLLTTSRPHGTFPHLSTTHGCISIIEFISAIHYCSFFLGKVRESFVLESVPSRCDLEKKDS